MTNNQGYSSESATAVRLLSSVAVVGRDNEPIYLRGDLCDCTTTISSPSASPVAATTQQEEGGIMSPGDDNPSQENNEGSDAGDDDDDGSSPSNDNRGGKGLIGRFKGVVGRNNNPEGSPKEKEEVQLDQQHQHGSDGANDDNNADPFGFFENNSNPLQSSPSSNNLQNINSSNIPAMSLTQQLVLHASLDRFEEMASRSNRGGTVRWRTPGSSNSANAMWMGLLCQVEERWNVYGYLTNTGIKFMILVENIYLNQDGSRRQQDHAPPSSSSLFVNNSLSSSLSNSGSREADLKNMFAQLHELYVRHTMNPFSKLRSPIQSPIFDKGIVQMAQSFNSSALEKVLSLEGGYVGGSNNRSNGLVWM
mmetsp:Transcript_30567/g.56481  ORF Transcript_30567/g.56481 Transcript_30567/m.56481 type:complete len:364 (+) Transcript_30567:100-1191(+)